ncbi:MAG: hypothetical protein BGO98_23270 [Myxococcales bacterium 68-20]|nr:MAG: hypothetical protein BGO98_23270 [Myxococcales bacterium 68-20]
MRYLFGDSTPFPLGYNFLTTLEAFMSASTRIVQLDVEGTALARQREELAQNRVKGLEALEQFHNVVMRAVQDTAQKVQHQHALEYARTVAEYATHYIEEHRKSTLGANERESLQLRSDSDRRASEMRAQLEAFLKAARIPVLTTTIALRLNIDGKEARHSGSAAFVHPDGIATSFTVAPHRTTAWTAPRKVADFAEGVALRVGVEKSWLRGTVTAKELVVDDWTIVQIDMSEDAFELALRRKLAEKEMLVFRIRRDEAGGVAGTVEHPGAPNAEALPGNLGGQDVAHLERVWAALKAATREVADQKEQLINVALDGQPVFESGLAVPFVVRLVSMFAPTVREIAKRSPNAFELTLKTEAEGGRREELYLRKEALVSTLQPLPAKGREVFAPLGLDTWVPSMTAAPPPVTVSEPPPRLDIVSDPPPTGHPAVPPVPSVPPSARKP